MADNCYHAVNISYKVLIFCILIAAIQRGIRRFIKDEDVSLIKFKFFHEEEEYLYPTTTMCFYNPFIESSLESYGPGINVTSYSQYLQGKLQDERMTHIPYDNVTVSMDDYLLEISGKLENRSIIRIYDKTGENEVRSSAADQPYYINFRSGLTKCFSFDIPYIHRTVVWSWFIKIRTSILPQGKRFRYINFDGTDANEGGFKILFHYPHQIFRNNFNTKYQWSEPTTPFEEMKRKRLGYYMQFRVRNIEVLTHRNTGNDPCNEDWKNDDAHFINQSLEDVGCTPPQLKCCNIPICSSMEKLSQIHEVISYPTTKDLRKYHIPCREIEKLQYEYTEGYATTEDDDENVQNEWFQVRTYFPDKTFKHIEQVFNFQSFFQTRIQINIPPSLNIESLNLLNQLGERF